MSLRISSPQLDIETELVQRMTTSSIEVVYRNSHCRQLVQRDAEKVEESLGDDAQSKPRIDLYPLDACETNVPSIVQKSIMLIIFEEHVFESEGD